MQRSSDPSSTAYADVPVLLPTYEETQMRSTFKKLREKGEAAATSFSAGAKKMAEGAAAVAKAGMEAASHLPSPVHHKKKEDHTPAYVPPVAYDNDDYRGLPAMQRLLQANFAAKSKLEEKRAEIFQRLHGCIGPSREQELKKRRRLAFFRKNEDSVVIVQSMSRRKLARRRVEDEKKRRRQEAKHKKMMAARGARSCVLVAYAAWADAHAASAAATALNKKMANLVGEAAGAAVTASVIANEACRMARMQTIVAEYNLAMMWGSDTSSPDWVSVRHDYNEVVEPIEFHDFFRIKSLHLKPPHGSIAKPLDDSHGTCTRLDWESHFYQPDPYTKVRPTYDTLQPACRPDTAIIRNLPLAWFGIDRPPSNCVNLNTAEMLPLRKAFGAWGRVMALDTEMAGGEGVYGLLAMKRKAEEERRQKEEEEAAAKAALADALATQKRKTASAGQSKAKGRGRRKDTTQVKGKSGKKGSTGKILTKKASSGRINTKRASAGKIAAKGTKKTVKGKGAHEEAEGGAGGSDEGAGTNTDLDKQAEQGGEERGAESEGKSKEGKGKTVKTKGKGKVKGKGTGKTKGKVTGKTPKEAEANGAGFPGEGEAKIEGGAMDEASVQTSPSKDPLSMGALSLISNNGSKEDSIVQKEPSKQQQRQQQQQQQQPDVANVPIDGEQVEGEFTMAPETNEEGEEVKDERQEEEEEEEEAAAAVAAAEAEAKAEAEAEARAQAQAQTAAAMLSAAGAAASAASHAAEQARAANAGAGGPGGVGERGLESGPLLCDVYVQYESYAELCRCMTDLCCKYIQIGGHRGNAAMSAIGGGDSAESESEGEGGGEGKGVWYPQASVDSTRYFTSKQTWIRKQRRKDLLDMKRLEDRQARQRYLKQKKKERKAYDDLVVQLGFCEESLEEMRARPLINAMGVPVEPTRGACGLFRRLLDEGDALAASTREYDRERGIEGAQGLRLRVGELTRVKNGADEVFKEEVAQMLPSLSWVLHLNKCTKFGELLEYTFGREADGVGAYDPVVMARTMRQQAINQAKGYDDDDGMDDGSGVGLDGRPNTSGSASASEALVIEGGSTSTNKHVEYVHSIRRTPAQGQRRAGRSGRGSMTAMQTQPQTYAGTEAGTGTGTGISGEWHTSTGNGTGINTGAGVGGEGEMMSTTATASQVTMMHPDYGLEDPRASHHHQQQQQQQQQQRRASLPASSATSATIAAPPPPQFASTGLRSLHGCTVLVPINKAFVDSGLSTFEPRCWGAHVLGGPYKMEDFYMLDAGRVDTVGLSCQLSCAVNGAGRYVVWVNREKDPMIKARVLHPNIECEHGIVAHIVDRILHPEPEVEKVSLPYVGTMRAYGSKSTKDLRSDTMATVRGSLRAVHAGFQRTIAMENSLRAPSNNNTTDFSAESSVAGGRRGSRADPLEAAPLFGGSSGPEGTDATMMMSQSADVLLMG